MNFSELFSAVKHLKKTCKCADCNKAYSDKDIFVLATSPSEVLFDLRCKSCGLATLITLVSGNDRKRLSEERLLTKKVHQVTPDDILDIKNFLNDFDGNFKKIFKSK